MRLEDFLADLEAKAKAATPGPWLPYEDKAPPAYYHRVQVKAGKAVVSEVKDFIDHRMALADAAYIAACDPVTVRLLVAVARAAEESRYLHHMAYCMTADRGFAGGLTVHEHDCLPQLKSAIAALEAHVEEKLRGAA
jgi:hypothetical protein